MIRMQAIFSNFMRRLSPIAVVILLLGCVACVEKRAENTAVSPLVTDTVAANPAYEAAHFDPRHTYSLPVCLQFQGKPLLTIGQNVHDLHPLFTKNRDPNGQHQELWDRVYDYYCIENEYILAQPDGSLNGMTYLSTDSLGTIFALSQSWLMVDGSTPESQQNALSMLCRTVFPCTCGKLDFEEKTRFVVDHQDFEEIFELSPDQGKTFDDGYWHFRYEAVLKPIARRE